MKTRRRAATTVAGLAALTLVLTACGGAGDQGGEGGDGSVSISVSGLPDRSKPEERAAFEDRLEQFRAANPDIEITAEETLWAPETFSAQVAGGTLPTVISVPPGEVPALVSRQQIRPVTEIYGANETFASLPESLQNMGRGADGEIYGVPEYAYSIGIMINRDVFEQAGLDPDQPFADWDELRAAAKQITDTTGAVGFAVPTTEGYGGWLVSSMIPVLGQPVMYQDGDDWSLDLTADATVEMFELLRDMRWEDGSMSSNSILGDGEISQQFAAGQIGMRPAGGDAYQNMILGNGLPPRRCRRTLTARGPPEAGGCRSSARTPRTPRSRPR